MIRSEGMTNLPDSAEAALSNAQSQVLLTNLTTAITALTSS